MSHPPGTSIHLIADLADCRGLDDLALIDRTLRDAAAAAGATVLETRLHPFGEGLGVTGVALLAESHISIHTWPETGLAAVDLFVCGDKADVHAGLRVIRANLQGRVSDMHSLARLATEATCPQPATD